MYPASLEMRFNQPNNENLFEKSQKTNKDPSIIIAAVSLLISIISLTQSNRANQIALQGISADLNLIDTHGYGPILFRCTYTHQPSDTTRVTDYEIPYITTFITNDGGLATSILSVQVKIPERPGIDSPRIVIYSDTNELLDPPISIPAGGAIRVAAYALFLGSELYPNPTPVIVEPQSLIVQNNYQLTWEFLSNKNTLSYTTLIPEEPFPYRATSRGVYDFLCDT